MFFGCDCLRDESDMNQSMIELSKQPNWVGMYMEVGWLSLLFSWNHLHIGNDHVNGNENKAKKQAKFKLVLN